MKHILFIAILALSLASCKKPSACIESSATSATLGQQVTFTDCSEDADKIIVQFANGERLENPGKTFVHAFDRPGMQTVTLKAFSKNEKKSDEVMVTVDIPYPQKSQVTGTWTYYKAMEYGQVFFGGTQLLNTYSYNDTYDFTSLDALLINGSYADNYNFSSTLAQLSYYSNTYNIILLNSTDMVLRDITNGPNDYTDHYFRR
jgi:PKD repeat protein